MNANQKSQCDYCAFKITEDQSILDANRNVEEKYSVLRSLSGAPKKPRIIHIGGDDDKTETCFINSPYWVRQKENIHCPDRIDNSLSLETALGFRLTELANKRAEEANSLARDANSITLATSESTRREIRKDRIMTIIAIIIAVIAARDDIKWLISWVMDIFNAP